MKETISSTVGTHEVGSTPLVQRQVNIIRYQVWPERVAENEALVRGVYRQLHELKPLGVHYATYKFPDGVTFQHVATFDTEEAHKVFTGLSAFKQFQEGVKDRCEIQPLVSKTEEIGSYGF